MTIFYRSVTSLLLPLFYVWPCLSTISIELASSNSLQSIFLCMLYMDLSFDLMIVKYTKMIASIGISKAIMSYLMFLTSQKIIGRLIQATAYTAFLALTFVANQFCKCSLYSFLSYQKFFVGLYQFWMLFSLRYNILLWSFIYSARSLVINLYSISALSSNLVPFRYSSAACYTV